MPVKLFLASKSPRRRELLQQITTDFTIIDSDFDEKEISVCAPEKYVQILAEGKASHTGKIPAEDELIIGCDTVVVSPDGKIFGKPADETEGFAMLKSLSGRTHSVITGVCLYSKNICHTFYSETRVTFYPLSDAEIRSYLSCLEYQDKAGGYGIQGKGALLCEKIEGDYFNIVGLPIAALSRALHVVFPAENV